MGHDCFFRSSLKSIEVASIEKSGGAIGPYMRVVSVKEQGGRPVAVVKLRVRGRNGVERLENCELQEGDSLQEVSQNPAVYPEDLKVLPFHREGKGKKAIGYVELMTPTGVQRVYEEGSYSDDDMVREMMAVTIETHLDRALHLNMQGIKVLSLFFLDSVSHYRVFDSETKQEDWGEYALLFEEIYTQIASREKYCTLFGGSPPPARSVHNGYFAKSKKTKTEPAHYTDKPGGEQEQSAYELIMKDKERLLSRDEPLQFIFTHSALQEGWDNPNVFQICILRDIRTTMSRRQALGRGLRLCVNESGSRVYDTNINRLTVIARESVKEFAAKLQKEYEAEGCRFGVITKESMGTLRFTNANGETEVLGQSQAQRIVEELTKGGMLQKGKPTAQLREALECGRLEKPASCPQGAWNAVMHYLCTQSQGVKVQDTRERRRQSVDMDVFLSPLFRELWERIKYRTTYRAHFDTEKLIDAVMNDLPEALSSLHRNVVVHVGEVDVAEAGLRAEEVRMRILQEAGRERRGLCDVLSYLEDATNLTRRTLAAILTKLPPETFRLIYQDEHGFLKTVIRIIKMHLARIRTACLEYMPVTVGERVYDAQRFLEEQEESYTSRMLAVTKGKCLTDCIIYDQSVESRFAESAEKCENVKLYFKLPSWFKIPTPLGNYNPDWAVVMENGGAQNLYFVVETKSLESLTELEAEVGGNQADKVRCGKAHFAAAVQQRAHALEPPVEYRGPITKVEDVLHC